MRKVAHGSVWFTPENKLRVLALMREQCSARRSAYQAIHKHGLKDNDVKKYVKHNYMRTLNQRYVADACGDASKIRHDNALFGGKKIWGQMIGGIITKDQWRELRNNCLYSRGDKTKLGNANIRIGDNKILVNDPAKRGLWIKGKLFMPKKYKPDLSCCEARLLYRGDKFDVAISWEETPRPALSPIKGAVGIDTNPDGIAVVEVDAHGNLLHHQYEREQRIQYASTNKRDNDIRLLSKRVVAKAVETGKPIVIERLNFGNKKGGRKFRRMRSNFIHRKITESIKSRAAKNAVEVKEVNPAFTSVLGELKYQKMYSLSKHAAAGLVIARRGLGLVERQNFTVAPEKPGSKRLKLEARGRSLYLTPKTYSFLQECFLREKPAGLTAPPLAAGSRHAIDGSAGVTPAGEQPTTGRLREIIDFFTAGERPPSSLVS